MPKSDAKDTARFITYKFTYLFSKTHNKSVNYFIKYVFDMTTIIFIVFFFLRNKHTHKGEGKGF